MSVIKPPRIYFDGYTEWDPNTCNNNKWLHFWDMKTAELDWITLKEKGVTCTNFKETFHAAASKMLPVSHYGCHSGTDTDPGEQEALWNFFGGNGCNFTNNSKIRTLVSGGVNENGYRITGDALIGEQITLKGNPFNNHPTPARLIDLDAASTMTSQIWFDQVQLGNDEVGFSGDRLDIMHSRFVHGPRNLTYGFEAGGAACVWQCSIPNSHLRFNGIGTGTSTLLDALHTQAQSAEGIMIRFVTYLTLYFRNGEFNDNTTAPRSAKEIEQLYLDSFKNGGPYFSNPAYSRTVGTIGVWRKGELQNAPSERTLFATKHPVAPTPPIGKHTAYPLGPVLIDVSYDDKNKAKTVHLDFGSTIPETDDKTPELPPKANFGDFFIHVVECDDKHKNTVEKGVEKGVENAVKHRLAYLSYDHYNEEAYINSSGMIDLPAAAPICRNTIEGGTLAIYSNRTKANSHKENINQYQTITRATYLDQDNHATVSVSSRTKGTQPTDDKVAVVRYRYDPQYPRIAECGGMPLSVISTDSQEQIAQFVDDGRQTIKPLKVKGTNDFAEVLYVNCDSIGDGQLQVHAPTPPAHHSGPAAGPGFVYLVFYPADITTVPHLADSSLLNKGCYGVVRVLPFDNGIQQEFVDLWNKNFNRQEVWEFIYNKILYFYDMIYPVMSRYVPLGELNRVEGAVDQLQATLSATYANQNSTMAMPITRDLSAAKRWVLLTWCELVKSNYQPLKLPDWKNPRHS
ncbi:hypothetical protein AB833_01515 [Chromatiales bacterium (ex Bugula neritina AB1)]|nr:hypothetical protein AB833_01515 [Chromatiales bacterium (ex Bugula neritina AB1)]